MASRGATWSPPRENCFKLKFNAAAFNDINASGFSAVICNELGEVMAAMTAKGPSVFYSEEPEVLACSKALEFSVDSGFVELIIKSDNATVMQTIACSRATLSPLGHLYGDIQCISSGLRAMSVSCVCRFANSVAHSLAKFARGIMDEIVCWRNPPHLR